MTVWVAVLVLVDVAVSTVEKLWVSVIVVLAGAAAEVVISVVVAVD